MAVFSGVGVEAPTLGLTVSDPEGTNPRDGSAQSTHIELSRAHR